MDNSRCSPDRELLMDGELLMFFTGNTWAVQILGLLHPCPQQRCTLRCGTCQHETCAASYNAAGEVALLRQALAVPTLCSLVVQGLRFTTAQRMTLPNPLRRFM